MPGKHRRFSKTLPLTVLIVAFCFSLCFRTAEPGFIPGQAASNLLAGLRLLAARLGDLPLYLDKWEIINSHPYYYETFIGLKNALVTCFSGMGICLAGAAFQTTFRNPLASPNMIGVSAGVSLGNIVFIFVFTTQALAMLSARYYFCFGFSFLLVGVVFLIARLAGWRAKRFSVLDMIVVGAVISQLSNVVVTYLQYRLEVVDYALLLTYQELVLGMYLNTDTISLLIFAGLILVSVIPVLLVRWRYNAASFDNEEALSMGVRPQRLRFLGLACGSVLAATALIYCGDIGMLAMAIPHICRYYDSDFKRLSITSMCYGGALLLVCRAASSLVLIGGLPMPVNFAISVVLLPLFIIVLRRQRSAFE